jgi:hypothetical protein
MRVGAVDDRPREPAGVVVDADQTLAQHRAVEELDDPVAPLQSRLDCEPGRQPLVQGSEIAQRIPRLTGIDVDPSVLVDRCHGPHHAAKARLAHREDGVISGPAGLIFGSDAVTVRCNPRPSGAVGSRDEADVRRGIEHQ